MSQMTITKTPDGVHITDIREMTGFAVEVRDADGALTLIPPPGTRITAEAWRRVPVGALMRAADHTRRGDIISAMMSTVAGGGGDPRPTASEDSTAAFHERVAWIYRRAIEHNVPPREALADAFDTDKPRTTQRWITAARRAGYLGTREEEKAAHTWPTIERTGPMTEVSLAEFTRHVSSPEYRKRTGRVRPGE